MYVGTVTGSTISLMNDFMESHEDYLLISDIFHIYSHNREDHFALMLGRMNEYEGNIHPQPSTIIISDFKKATGKNIYITDIEKKLKMEMLTPTNISLPMYILLKKCVALIKQKAVYPDDYETLIKFDSPIEISAKCDRRSDYPDFKHYNEGTHFPIVGLVPFETPYLLPNYDFDQIKIWQEGELLWD